VKKAPFSAAAQPSPCQQTRIVRSTIQSLSCILNLLKRSAAILSTSFITYMLNILVYRTANSSAYLVKLSIAGLMLGTPKSFFELALFSNPFHAQFTSL